jgi:polyhydroxyalkanoic acid synthase PhaR subunit
VTGTKVTYREERHLEGKELLSTMSKQPDITNPLDPLGTWRAARDAGLESWSRMMIDLVNSEAYSQATSQWLDTYLTFSQPFQRIIETTMTQVLAGLNMPTRTDVTTLAGRLTNVEVRLDDLDARLDDIQRAVQTLPASKQAADAKVEARLDKLDAKLDDIERAVQALPASKQAADTKVEARLDKLDTRLDDLQRAIKALPTPEQTADAKVEARLDDLNTKLTDIQHAIKATAAPKRPAGTSAKAKEVRK